jgi:hypothetical protein
VTLDQLLGRLAAAAAELERVNAQLDKARAELSRGPFELEGPVALAPIRGGVGVTGNVKASP